MIKKIGYWFLGLTLLLVVFGVIFVNNNKPQYKGSLELDGLSDEVRVYFDDIGVPHIFAAHDADAYRALGFVHAQDRLWQMELVRRVGSGRLSEIFGEDLIETDQLFRTLGISQAAKETISRLDTLSEAYQLTQAYLNGINQFVAQDKLPLEFKLLGVEAEPFELEDVFSVFGYMAFGFAQAHKTDPMLSQIQSQLGKKYLSDLDIDISPKTTLIHNSKRRRIIASNNPGSVSNVLNDLPVPPFIGSNSWVLGPKKTANGKVIFANDPHIGFSQPSVWYQAHIITPSHEMYGFHLALCPFPLLGHNQKYAYGITMLENDDIDFYELNPEVDLRTRTEIIRVKGEDDLTFEVNESESGPIVNEVLKIQDRENPIAMSWVYTQSINDILQVAFEISRSKNLKDFRQGVAEISAPGLNMMYGDAKGNIAWFGAAKLYEREAEVHSKFIIDGTNQKNFKRAYLEFDQNPQAINPRSNFVYSANNQPAEVNEKLYPGYYLPEDRARRIVELLQDKSDFSQKDVEEMTLDVTSSVTKELTGIILENISKVNLSDLEKEAIGLLGAWDGSYLLESSSPTIYFKFLYLFLKNTFADEMGEELFDQFLKTHLYKRQIAKQLKLNKSIWWDDVKTKEVKELKDEIITRSFHQAIAELEDQFGDDIENWAWTEAISVTHKHAFDKSTTLRSLFNVGPYSTNGALEVINNQLFELNGSGQYKIKAGPSTRRIIDFSDVENARAILPTGQSGRVFSQYYDDQAEKYHKGEFVQMMINQEEIKKSKNILLFSPQKN